MTDDSHKILEETQRFKTLQQVPDRILVVDDDPLIRDMLNKILSQHGYVVDLSDGGGDALEKLIDYDYHLLLLDANMPGISGFELLKYCKRHHPDTEIIMITGNPGLEDAVSTVKDGAFDYIAKPFAIDNLLSRVKDAIDTQKRKVATLSKLPTTSDSGSHISPDSPLPDYKIIKTLGSGTMGVVLHVEKHSIPYALKILRKAGDESTHHVRVNRFLREAEVLSKIEHPNVVRIFRSGFPKDSDVPFILMEYVDGRPLTDYIKKGTLSITQKLEIIKQIAMALAAVHKAGILHRDIKPSNILVTPQHIAKLSDFGIARISDSSLTMTHEVLGSPAYMPPEAFNSKKMIDSRSDIFSLGVLAYELFTGTKPFHGETVAEMMEAIQHSRPIEPRKLIPDLSMSVQKLLAKMIEKRPSDRYETAQQIVDAIQEIIDGKSKESTSPSLSFLKQIIRGRKVWD